VKDAAKHYYPNSICIDNYDDLFIHNDWVSEKFDIPVITIDICDYELYPKKCATKDKIEDFVKSNMFYAHA